MNISQNKVLAIKKDCIENQQLRTLLEEHHAAMLKLSPLECVHALDMSAFTANKINFYTAWFDENLVGCAALKKLDNKHVELKSMKTSVQFLRKGVAASLLTYLVTLAKEQGYEKISLETGTASEFIPAQKLYQRFGFTCCSPFSTYKQDPYSLFFSKRLTD